MAAGNRRSAVPDGGLAENSLLAQRVLHGCGEISALSDHDLDAFVCARRILAKLNRMAMTTWMAFPAVHCFSSSFASWAGASFVHRNKLKYMFDVRSLSSR